MQPGIAPTNTDCLLVQETCRFVNLQIGGLDALCYRNVQEEEAPMSEKLRMSVVYLLKNKQTNKITEPVSYVINTGSGHQTLSFFARHAIH